MLAEDDTTSICPKADSLTIVGPYHDMNLSARFPNIRTLTVLTIETLDLHKFRRLRHLITDNMELLPHLTPRIHTLTLINKNGIHLSSTIYSYVHHLIISKFFVNNPNTITSIQRYFPNLHSLNIQFVSNPTIFRDSLDILFDARHWPDFKLLRTNWVDEDFYHYHLIKIWLSDNTELKSRSDDFYAHCDGQSLTVWL
ncbi:unnamed protein product [Adineta steineri]|uniref:Uncharacterized protein n=1 Tax=Adineta steineri TaxID=433720 RepID=A0A818WKK9_9BILA|nr:unnamed protein product [Adineta steineri]CAF3726256.1 unnamed protein product [Adineta steineri]